MYSIGAAIIYHYWLVLPTVHVLVSHFEIQVLLYSFNVGKCRISRSFQDRYHFKYHRF